MLTALRKELHYQYRCVRLARDLLLKRMLHCNLQVTYRCNFRCQICDFWKPQYQTAHELSLADIRVIGAKLNRLGTMIISLAGGEPLIREDLSDVIAILNRAHPHHQRMVRRRRPRQGAPAGGLAGDLRFGGLRRPCLVQRQF
jgi:uncharacterized radical SAM superfamily Fe-S cluster-containing enzyme